jgi:hypothetical protein
LIGGLPEGHVGAVRRRQIADSKPNASGTAWTFNMPETLNTSEAIPVYVICDKLG